MNITNIKLWFEMAKKDAVSYRRSIFVSKLGRKIEKDSYYGKNNSVIAEVIKR